MSETSFSEENAMCLVAAMVAEDLAIQTGADETTMLVELLTSKVGEQLFDSKLKLWWDGPAYVADAFLRERGLSCQSS